MAKTKVKEVEVSGDSSTDEVALQRIEDLNKQLAKTYGPDFLQDGYGNNCDGVFLSSGSLRVDLALRYPFFVGIHEIAGGYGSGKSTMAIHICISAQQQGWPVYYIDFERALNDAFLERFKGLNRDKKFFHVLKPRNAEEATQSALDIFRTVEHAVVVYDSVPCTKATEAVLAANMTDQHMAIVSRIMGTFLPKAKPAVADSNGRLILINQLRANLSPYSGAKATSGGNPVEHWTDSRLFLRSSNNKKMFFNDAHGDLIGKTIEVTIDKNKRGKHPKKTSMIINYDSGIWAEKELFLVAQEISVVERRGAYYYFNGEQICKGVDATWDLIQSDPELSEQIRSSVVERMGM